MFLSSLEDKTMASFIRDLLYNELDKYEKDNGKLYYDSGKQVFCVIKGNN